ncbi:ATP-binding protein [Actinomadura nitritigenes]|uniref:histidine kinase n=1 Tax=Actinomadura nitritigenes TaxID=134602 RepID=A0ABS3QZ42_9ACTN|nr:ATP-binding protein [Actinomadura nitritigenes]MBO2439264.1 sensor histidine kinase [Actinomadura nitritigenes]
MPDFFEPAAGADRRDVQRCDRTPTHGRHRQTGMHVVHLAISVLPAAAVGLLGTVAVAALYDGGALPRSTRTVLAVAALGTVTALLAAAWAAGAATRRVERHRVQGAGRDLDAVRRRLGELAVLAVRGRRELREMADRLGAGEPVGRWNEDPPPADPADPAAQLACELRRAQGEAWNAVLDAASRRAARGDRRVDVFVSLARRMQSLSHRAIQGLDGLENQVEDPDLLKGLFKVDHLATRTRRQAESLAVIGGAASRRQWTRPVTVYEMLRSAIAEVEHYKRVKVVPPVEGSVHGGAVADIVHLLAELIENATKYSPPHTQVLVRVEGVAAGLAVEVEDRGLGIPGEDRRRLNDLLADQERGHTEELLGEGRIGLHVVSALARRHKVRVQLQTNVYGGTQAVVVVPTELTGGPEEAEAPARAGHAAPVPAPDGPPPGPRHAAPPRTDPAPGGPAHDDAAPGGPAHHDPAAHDGQGVPVFAQGASVPAAPHRPAAPTWDTGPQPPVAGPAAGPAVPPPDGERPELPRRQAQRHLSPELATVPVHREPDHEAEHNPGLMAAFQKGMRSALDNDAAADGPDTGK